MNRKYFTIVLIILQIGILSSFIIRYEILKRTGTTVYIPLRGYDPTDIFRGDYVNLSYELPFSGGLSHTYTRYLYIIPKLENNAVVGIEKLVEKAPPSGIYFRVQNWWMNQEETYTIDGGSGKILNHRSAYCRTDLNIGDDVAFPLWNMSDSTIVSDLSKIREGTLQDTENGIEGYGKILSKSICGGIFRFQATSADRWFVPEGTGLDIEKEIRKGGMYAEWKIAENGAIIVTNIVSRKDLLK